MQDVFFVFLGWLSSILEPEGRDSAFKRFTRKLLVPFPILEFSVRFSQGSHQENGEDSILAVYTRRNGCCYHRCLCYILNSVIFSIKLRWPKDKSL